MITCRNHEERSANVNSVQFPSSVDERDPEATSDVVIAQVHSR